MNQHNKLYNLVKTTVFALFLSMVIFGCSDNSKQQAIGFADKAVSEQNTIEESPVGDTVMGDKDVCVVKDGPEGNKPNKGDLCFAHGPGSDKTNPDLDLDKYIAVLEVDKRIKLTESGTAFVWIGLKEKMRSMGQNVSRDTTSLEPGSGRYARITLKVDDCSPNDPVVMELQPSSSVRFTIKPEKKGKINVYANIEFFEDKDCTVSAHSMEATKNLHVKVYVSYLDEIWDKFMGGFSYFWTALVALFFGALLFVIRRFVKEKTGYDEEENNIITKKESAKRTKKKSRCKDGKKGKL